MLNFHAFESFCGSWSSAGPEDYWLLLGLVVLNIYIRNIKIQLHAFGSIIHTKLFLCILISINLIPQKILAMAMFEGNIELEYGSNPHNTYLTLSDIHILINSHIELSSTAQYIRT